MGPLVAKYFWLVLAGFPLEVEEKPSPHQRSVVQFVVAAAAVVEDQKMCPLIGK